MDPGFPGQLDRSVETPGDHGCVDPLGPVQCPEKQLANEGAEHLDVHTPFSEGPD